MGVHLGIISGSPSYMEIPGCLDKGDIWLSIIPECPGYLGILGYLDKGDHTAIYPGIIP